MKKISQIIDEVLNKDPLGLEIQKEECIEIAEIWAKQQAIRFAKWLNKEGWEEYDDSDRWICPSNNRNVYLTSKLYERFLNSTK